MRRGKAASGPKCTVDDASSSSFSADSGMVGVAILPLYAWALESTQQEAATPSETHKPEKRRFRYRATRAYLLEGRMILEAYGTKAADRGHRQRS